MPVGEGGRFSWGLRDRTLKSFVLVFVNLLAFFPNLNFTQFVERVLSTNALIFVKGNQICGLIFSFFVCVCIFTSFCLFGC